MCRLKCRKWKWQTENKNNSKNKNKNKGEQQKGRKQKNKNKTRFYIFLRLRCVRLVLVLVLGLGEGLVGVFMRCGAKTEETPANHSVGPVFAFSFEFLSFVGDIPCYFRLYAMASCAAVACLARGFWAGWAVASRELRFIVFHATRENSRRVGRMQLLVDTVKVYEAHDLELENCTIFAKAAVRYRRFYGLYGACVDLVEDCKNQLLYTFLSRKKVKSKQRNRMAIIICNHHVQLCSLQTIGLCKKMSRQRPARSPSFARQLQLETVLIKPQVV